MQNPVTQNLVTQKSNSLQTMGPPPASTPPSNPMPKMGVRARVSEWPQRKDVWDARPPPRYDSLLPSLQDHLLNQEALLGRAGPYPLSELLSHAPMRSLARIKRSNSEVTLSDLGADEDQDYCGATLRREYGSTSSLGGHSSQDLLGPLVALGPDRVVQQEQPSAPPGGFPPLLSPSLLTAAQIARGDYVDPSLLFSAQRDRPATQRGKPEKAETSIFKRLKSVKTEAPPASREAPGPRHLTAPTSFSHHDVQSLLFSPSQAGGNRGNGRRNSGPGDSVASRGLSAAPGGVADPAEGTSSQLVSTWPGYRRETGEEREGGGGGEGAVMDSSNVPNAAVSVLEVPRGRPVFPGDLESGFTVEHLDQGAFYYQKYFYNREHQNFLGTDQFLGPVSLSVRREKLEEDRDGPHYNYRIILRTSQPSTLRGSILEDSVPSSSKHGGPRGLPLKEVLDYVLPELSTSCLRVASSAPAVPELLLQLDQQWVSLQHQVGVLLCRGFQGSSQTGDSDWSTPALNNFLDLLGQKISQKPGQLNADAGSAGGHCVYATYKDHEVMFHISTPTSSIASDPQQLLRNQQGVQLVFQEPGAPPFTPIGPSPQGVYLVVRVHGLGTAELCYSVAVTRPRDVPTFGPPLPPGATFPHGPALGDFLLAKIINGQNAVRKAAAAGPSAAQERHLALRQLVATWQSATPLEGPAPRFSFITLGGKKKERSRPPGQANLHAAGGVAWPAAVAGVACLLAVSQETVVLAEEDTGEVLFNCSCRDVIGWSVVRGEGKIYFQRGERVSFSLQDDGRDLSQRLQLVTRGCVAVEAVLRRNSLGQLGFHVNAEGVVADLEPYGFAWQTGLRPGCRLVEICKVAVATLAHQQMIELLRTPGPVAVVVIAAHEDGSPRRSFTEMYPGHFRTAAQPWHSGLPGAPPLSRASPNQGPSPRASPSQGPSPSQKMFHYAPAGSISRSSSFDRPENSRMHQGYAVSPSGTQSRGEGLVFCNSPSNQSTTSDPGPNGTWSQCSTYRSSPSPTLVAHPAGDEGRDQSKQDPRTRSSDAQGRRPSAKLHKLRERPPVRPSAQPTARLASSRTTAVRGSSSVSSTNTMSSTNSSASSGPDRPFGSSDPMDSQELGLTYIQGASTDSGIDTPPVATPPAPPLSVGEEEGRCLEGYCEAVAPDRVVAQGVARATASGNPRDGSLGNLSESSSQSSGSRCSKNFRGMRGSPATDVTSPLSRGAGQPTQDNPIGWKKAKGCSGPERPDSGADALLYLLNSLSLRSSLQLQLQPYPAREAFLRMITSDSCPEETDQSLLSATPLFPASPWRPLQRSMSEESLWSHHQRSMSLISSRSSLLDASTLPYGSTLPYRGTLPYGSTLAYASTLPYRSTLPYGSTLPCRSTPPPHSSTLPWDSSLAWASLRKNRLSCSDGALAERTKMAEVGRAWSQLVTAARSSPGDQFGVGAMLDLDPDQKLCHRVDTLQYGDKSAALLSGKVNQLEEALHQLQLDLRKEQEDKLLLQQEVQLLRHDNMRLHQESLSNAAQFSRYTHWLLQPPQPPHQ